ncbi:LytR/AlgR family response regulator transcription factor [Culturomica massiliensis]|uniref:LytR/AlgR family response regulator transcription factor n=1 Tax=Culturomica massiliensis TaxID=1841857 RepID=UPI00093E5FFD|nr:LytTR family DNA-binding domain-containing protein [Culturomica massiliensis]
MDKTIIIKTSKEITPINTKDISHIEIDSDCCTFHFDDGSKFSCSKSLNNIERLLPSYFIRVHRNCIINTNKIVKINIKNRIASLQNGNNVKISVRKLKYIKYSLISLQKD